MDLIRREDAIQAIKAYLDLCCLTEAKFHKGFEDYNDEIAREIISDIAEPSSSEKPNNYCDDCLYTDTCDSKEFFYACTSKATISKMEQVEDEPKTDCDKKCKQTEVGCEQTDCAWRKL